MTSEGGFGEMGRFVNPDNSVVIVAGNSGSVDKLVSFKVNNSVYSPVLKANSVNTLLIK